jgi:hypothetical protein
MKVTMKVHHPGSVTGLDLMLTWNNVFISGSQMSGQYQHPVAGDDWLWLEAKSESPHSINSAPSDLEHYPLSAKLYVFDFSLNDFNQSLKSIIVIHAFLLAV